MNAEDRQQDTLARLRKTGRVDIADLAARYQVSEMTVRRDLNELVSAGLATRVHGGATSTASGSFEPPFALRARTNRDAKRRIALAVARQVHDGQTVILDGGTTGVEIARELSERNVTVCALNLKVAEVLAASSSVHTMIPGGQVRTGESSIIGAQTQDFLQQYTFDAYVMTASAVSASSGFTEWNTEDAAVKRAALAASRTCVAAVDGSKFGQQAFARVCGLDRADLVVTDESADAGLRQDFTLAGTELLIA